MRILAIRGKNLASLSGEFAIELDCPPLDQSGLFAITGATGAGKSTLLDALCLALYDEMPRLFKVQGVAVGRTDEDESVRVRSNDVRTILRRGTGEGYAEVDFVSSDGRRYRARWEVRRARGKADGRLQSQVLSLQNLETGQALGHHKTEVLEVIAERLGLSFEQFRRSALLPQGDFAAFLKVDAKQRSELLERITGTEIYSQLSIAAHRRASEEKLRLTSLEQQLGHLQPLNEQARRELEQKQAERHQVLFQVDAARQAAEQALQWHRRLAQLQAAEQEAAAALEQLEQAWQTATPRREQLRLVQRAQALRPLVEAHDHTHEEQQRAEQALNEAHTAEAIAREAVEQSKTLWLGADQRWQSIITQQEAARPLLKQAQLLDAQLTAAQAHLSQTEREHAEATAKAEQAEQHRCRCQAEQANLAAQRQVAATWLEENAHLADLAGQWERWDSELQRYARATAEVDRALKLIRKIDDKAEQLAQALLATQDRYAVIQAATAEFQARLKALEDEAARYSLDELSSARIQLEQRREQWRELHRQVLDAVRINQELTQARASRDACHAQEVQTTQAAAEQAQALAAKREALAEAERALQLAVIARKEDVASLRERLRDGEPCPVCGASEHPWAQDASPLNRLLADQQQRVDGLKSQVNESAQAHARLETEREHARAQGAQFTNRIEKLQTDLDGLQNAWSRRPATEPLPDDPLANDLPAILTDQLREVQKALAELGKTEQLARDCHRQVTSARSSFDKHGAERDHLQQQLSGLQQAVQQVGTDRSAQETALQRAKNIQQEVLALLAAPLADLPNWPEVLAADPAAFREQGQTLAHTFREHQQVRDSLALSLQKLTPELVAAQATASHAQEEAARVTEALQAHTQALETLQRQRGALFDGRPTATVEQEWLQLEKQTREQVEKASQALEKANTNLAAAQQGLRHWEAEWHRRAMLFEQARTRLEPALAQQGLDLRTLREQLQYDLNWLEAERSALDAMDKQRERAQTLLEVSRQQRSAYETSQPPRHNAEEAQLELERLESEYQTAQQVFTEMTVQLKQDDHQRIQARGLQTELDRQRQCWELWAQLQDLIGSHDGTKFRTFAQSLTLDVLIAHANGHLQDLARRYRLERVPGSDLELQVIDREMGDEVRSVHSLSGGESFLVSLALALGLASLSSHRTQVESLFIDEGFGSLDPDTLDIALASLDALQSLGRQVGVISHVPALVERIGVQVRVETRGGGRSVVRILETGPAWEGMAACDV